MFINGLINLNSMNFQGLSTIEDSKFYIDFALKKASEKASLFRSSKKLMGTRNEKSIRIELVRIDAIRDALADKLFGIGRAFPDTEALPEFYNELLKATVDFPELKRSLAGVKWARSTIMQMHKNYSNKIKKCRELQKISFYRREFYGRVCSVLKQINPNLKQIEIARRTMKGFPAIKTGVKTIAIAGFPNVGKTTLLMKLTGAKADIQPYAFTTQGINVGYLQTASEKIQFLDTPGTLNRFDKMNNIEKVAYLALRLLAEKIIYVFDLTEPYPLEEQEKLFEVVKKMNKQVIVYISKTDILDKDDYREFAEKYEALDEESIKKAIF